MCFYSHKGVFPLFLYVSFLIVKCSFSSFIIVKCSFSLKCSIPSVIMIIMCSFSYNDIYLLCLPFCTVRVPYPTLCSFSYNDMFCAYKKVPSVDNNVFSFDKSHLLYCYDHSRYHFTFDLIHLMFIMFMMLLLHFNSESSA